MSAANLKERLSRRPFDPFRVVLSSGDTYEVRHPEMALLLRNGIYIAVPEAAEDLPENAVWCSLLHVAAVETITSSRRPGGGNGQAK
jgi:hypothetical protein